MNLQHQVVSISLLHKLLQPLAWNFRARAGQPSRIRHRSDATGNPDFVLAASGHVRHRSNVRAIYRNPCIFQAASDFAASMSAQILRRRVGLRLFRDIVR
jgi:hypothetical protein